MGQGRDTEPVLLVLPDGSVRILAQSNQDSPITARSLLAANPGHTLGRVPDAGKSRLDPLCLLKPGCTYYLNKTPRRLRFSESWDAFPCGTALHVGPASPAAVTPSTTSCLSTRSEGGLTRRQLLHPLFTYDMCNTGLGAGDPAFPLPNALTLTPGRPTWAAHQHHRNARLDMDALWSDRNLKDDAKWSGPGCPLLWHAGKPPASPAVRALSSSFGQSAAQGQQACGPNPGPPVNPVFAELQELEREEKRHEGVGEGRSFSASCPSEESVEPTRARESPSKHRVAARVQAALSKIGVPRILRKGAIEEEIGAHGGEGLSWDRVRMPTCMDLEDICNSRPKLVAGGCNWNSKDVFYTTPFERSNFV